MAKKELTRKIIATILTVTVLGCVLGGCVWLLMGSTVLPSSSHTHAPSAPPSTVTVMIVAMIFRVNSFFAIVQLH